MVLNTSALLAVLLNEPEAADMARVVASDPRRLVSAFTALETSVVIEAKKGENGGRAFDLLAYKAGIDIVPMVNIGDCCSYALARYTGEPLLFKGEDFAKTDARPVPLG